MIAFPEFGSPRAQAQSTKSESYWNTVDLVSGWSAYPVTFDGRISEEREWSDAYQQDVILYRGWFPDEPHLRTDDFTKATFYLKNDRDWLYLLVHASSIFKEPEDIGLSQFWWSWQGTWDGGRLAGVRRGGSTFDAYYVNDTYFKEVAPSNVRGASSCAGLESGLDCWFEFAETLRSDEPTDWALYPGDIVGTSQDHRANVYVDFAGGEQYVRFITLHLSAETESEKLSQVETTYDWRPTQNTTFGYSSFAVSPDFVVKTSTGTYEVSKIVIETTIRKSTRPWDYAFDLGVTVGDAPETFSLKCNADSCVPTSTNPYYGLALLFDSRAHGDQRVEAEIDFDQLEFVVVSSNSTRSPTRILHSDRLSYDSIFSTTGSAHLNLILWSGHRERAGDDLQVINATLRIQLSPRPRLLGMLPRPTFEEDWTSDISRGEDVETPIAGLVLTDDGRTLIAANVFNDRTGRYEAAEIYFLNSQGGLLWSKKYQGGMFFWNLLNLGLTPDGKIAAYAIYSSNKSDAGIWYVDSNGDPIWTYHEQWYHSVSVSADGRLVAAVKSASLENGKLRADGNVLALNGEGQVLWQHRFPTEMPMRVVVSAEGTLIAVATGVDVGLQEAHNSAVYLFDANGRNLWRHVGASIARAVDLSPQAGKAVVSYSDGTIELLDLSSGAVSSRFFHTYAQYDQKRGYYSAGDTFSAAITREGDQIVTSQGFGVFVFVNGLSSLLSVPFMPDSVSNVAESSGGEYVAIGTFGGKLRFYRFNLDRTSEYLRDLDRLRIELQFQNATPVLDSIAQLESQGRWRDAYQMSVQSVNATLAAARSSFSKSYTQTQADFLDAREMFNTTSTQFKNGNLRLNLSDTARVATMLSEASGLLVEAESYLTGAPLEYGSGNYLIALKSVRGAALSIEGAISRINHLNAIASTPAASGFDLFILLAIGVPILLASLAVWTKRRRNVFHKP